MTKNHPPPPRCRSIHATSMRLLTTGVVVILAFASFSTPLAVSAVAPLLQDNTAILDVPGESNVHADSWTDSYSVGDRCYCDTTYDHDIADIVVEVPTTAHPTHAGVEYTTTWLTVREVCEMLGPGPGRADRPVYNDIQCGNGPANTAGDEDTCPGRTDHGRAGCGYIGPTWKLFDDPASEDDDGPDDELEEEDDDGEVSPPEPMFPEPTQSPVPPAPVPVPTTTTTSPTKNTVLLLNAGVNDGPYVTGNVWTSAFDPVIDTTALADASVYPADWYQTHRSGRSGFAYTFPDLVPNQRYTVTLGWAENWNGACQPGQRVFSVFLQGTPWVTELDVVASTGSCYTAMVESTIARANLDGTLVMRLDSSVQNPMVSVIEIATIHDNEPTTPVAPPPTTSSPVVAPVVAPVATPPPLPTTTCGRQDFQRECRTTRQCQRMYDGADDCWNGGGGVCYCGDDVCGCRAD